MSTVLPNEYRFATQAQWSTGLARRLMWVGDHMQVTAAFASQASRVGPEEPAGPIAVAAQGAIYWVQYPDTLQWRCRHQEQSGAIVAAPQLVRSQTLVAGRRRLWSFDAGRAELYRFPLDTLAEPETYRVRELAQAHSPCDEVEIVDIAADGCEGLWVLLLCSGRPLQLVRISEHGTLRSVANLPYCNGVPTAIAAVGGEIAVLHADTQRLMFVRVSDFSISAEIVVATLGQGFQSSSLTGDGVSQVTVGGTAAGRRGRITQVYVLSRTASGVDCVDARSLPEAGGVDVRSAAHRSDELWVSTAAGIWRFGPATGADPDQPVALYLTPVLMSPQVNGVQGWLRAELDIDLPLGTRVSIGYASTTDQQTHDDILALSGQSDTPAEQRIAQIDTRTGNALTNTAIEFTAAAGDEMRQTLSIPLSRPMNDAPGTNTDVWLWVLVSVTSGAAGPLPNLYSLRVLYPFASLMEHLPAIFRGPGQVNGFMLDLVGILETTTQGIDAEIGALGPNLDPLSAPPQWLDVLAGWLAVPWDTGLALAQKRAILRAAPQLLAQRGTRAGLLAFLRCLFPTAPVDIFDQAAQVEPARVGGAHCVGAVLPAIIAGWPRRLAVLGDKAVVDCAHLACGLPTEIPNATLPSILRIVIGASRAERDATPLTLVESLLAAVVPAECPLVLCWRRLSGVGPEVEPDGTLVLDGPRPMRLSDNLELGYALLAGNERGTLDVTGLATDERLQ